MNDPQPGTTASSASANFASDERQALPKAPRSKMEMQQCRRHRIGYCINDVDYGFLRSENMFWRSCLIATALVLFLLMPAGIQSADGFSGLILGGSNNAPIRIEVFSDFECPGCRTFYLEVIRPLLQEYSSKDKVCVIYYEFPLNTHKHARQAARYCEAAYRIGRDQALRVMDALYAEQAQWKYDGDIEKAIAKTLTQQQLKTLKLKMRDPSINKAIDQGIQLAKAREVTGTPTMFVYYWGKKQRVENPHQLVYKYFKKDFLDEILR